METPTFSEEIQRYLSMMRRWGWSWTLAAILGASIAFIVSWQNAPVYQAAALVLVDEAPSARPVDLGSIQARERLARTYAETMTTRPVLEGVIQILDLRMSVDDLQRSIQAQPLRDTQLIRIQVEHTDPRIAATIANAVVSEFSRQNQIEQALRFTASKENLEAQLREIDQYIQWTSTGLEGLGDSVVERAKRNDLEASLALYRSTYTSLLQSYEMVRLAEAQATSTVVLKDPAIPPSRPVRPRILTNTILAAAAGFALAVGMACFSEAASDTLRSPEDVARRLGAPILGAITSHDHREEKPITMEHPRAPASEAFRSLRTNIEYSDHYLPLRTILVTSPSFEESKTAVAANLAIVLAQTRRSVALLDVDLRQPNIHQLLGLPNHTGIRNLLVENGLSLDCALINTEVPGLVVVTSGQPPPNPTELLASVKMKEVLKQILDKVECIVIDSPPVLPVADASVLAPHVDGVLLVVKPGVTRLAAAQQAIEQMQRVGANLLGVVLSEVNAKRSGTYYPYYKGYYDKHA